MDAVPATKHVHSSNPSQQGFWILFLTTFALFPVDLFMVQLNRSVRLLVHMLILFQLLPLLGLDLSLQILDVDICLFLLLNSMILLLSLNSLLFTLPFLTEPLLMKLSVVLLRLLHFNSAFRLLQQLLFATLKLLVTLDLSLERRLSDSNSQILYIVFLLLLFSEGFLSLLDLVDQLLSVGLLPLCLLCRILQL